MTLSIPPSIQCQTEAACRLITRVTGDTLRAIHLYGSAVAGGLKPNSDIDLLVTICQPLTEAQRATLMQELLAREDICQGIYEPAQQDWDMVLLITQILETSIPLKGERAERLFTPAPAAQLLKALRYPLDLWQSTADVQGDEYHIVLTLARIWYTLSTGRFTSKDAAADWLLPQLPEDYAATLRAAQREYLGLEQQDWHILLPAVVRFVDFAKAHIPTQFT
ncbi:aminoglycoside resistance protein [Salmonella enterica subsp. enterica serovar Typhimurium]|nr:aminoglycoside resistance protein [Salmonella enterica subsp. enterica serovar Typhimurium]